MTEHPSGSDRPAAAATAAPHIASGRKKLRLSLFMLGAFASLLLFLQFGGAAGAAAQVASITVDAHDFASGDPLAHFNYIVNIDNSKLPGNSLALDTESYSPIVKEGNESTGSIDLPSSGCGPTGNAGPGGVGCRYLISVRAPSHKLWGRHVLLGGPNGDTGTIRIDLTEASKEHPLPLGKIRVFVFNDNFYTNGAPDTEENGLNGFRVELTEQTGNAVTVDYHNQPLCGGQCITAGLGEDAGFTQISGLGPATYFIDVHPPDSCNPNNPNASSGSGHWYQTTTIDGGLSLIAPTEEGADGTGAPGEQLWEPPNNRTAYWFGFVCAPHPFQNGGSGEVTGTARNWVEWAPYTTGTYNDPVENPFVALSDADTGQTLFVGQGDANGNFDIQGVPFGSYILSAWDEQLSYIMRFKNITVDADNPTVDVNELGDDGEPGLGVSRWFGWLEGTVYKDRNNNGQYDPGFDPPIPNTDMDQRWRDGSIKESTFTDAAGHYEYPTAEGGALGRWIINEQGFARFSAFPGASTHDEHTGAVMASCEAGAPATDPCVPNSLGGGLLMNQLMLEGHRAVVDWGKRDYPTGTPGQIVGITYFATTRNEFEAYKQAHEDYEPAIPDVTVLLETPGPDHTPNTVDDVVVNKYVTDHWQQPSTEDPPDKQTCNPLRDFNGVDITAQFNPKIGENCLEVPLTGQQTKEGAFDGGYAFADYCPQGYDLGTDTCVGGGDPVSLDAGTYITHAIMPKDASGPDINCNNGGHKWVTSTHGSVPGGGTDCLFRSVQEDDVNVDLGNQFEPAIPPPPCVGDDHVVDGSTLTPRSTYHDGDVTQLCDKKLVVLENGQNANADFNLMTNFKTDPSESDSSGPVGDVAEPGRLVGQVFNDIYFERNQQSPWYGEPRPIAGIPVGIYARADTKPNINCPDPNAADRCFTPDKWRLLTTVTTSADGSFEALVPSTETFNCPIPQGPCPGMYLVTVDDPGSKAHPNKNFNPNLLIATTPAEAWPGLTTQLDLPLDPISGTGCEDPAVEPVPNLLQVDTPVITGNAPLGTNRRITISADFIGTTQNGANGGTVTLTDDRTGAVSTLTRTGNAPGDTQGGIVSWTVGTGAKPDTIVIQLPPINSNNFRPGPKQLKIITSAANGRKSTVNGITIHVLGSNGTGTNVVTYNPPVVNVAPPPPAGGNPHALQDAIDGATAGSLLVLSAGTYNENILLWKPLKIQGLGPGGIIGSHELQGRDPEDPRFNVAGSVIDGRYFQENATAFDATVDAHKPYVLPPFSTGPDSVVLRGADITVVAKDGSAYNVPSLGSGQDSPAFNGARIDGLGLTTGQGEGAGGIQLQASINNMQMTNNVLENNGGIFAGGIGLGQPYVHGSHNHNVRIANDRLIGNGGLTTSGGAGIFYDSDNYELARSILCSNFSVEYGAGLSHIGLSPGGSIHDNQIYYNDAVDAGAGIAIESELPKPLPLEGSIGTGTGAVDVDRNLIQANFSNDDGGGIFVLDSLDQPINVRNNMIVDNGAGDLGGAMMLNNAANVRIINNTVANNVSTGSSENNDGKPHSAGLASEGNDPLWQNDPRYAALYPGATPPDFSDPKALFNNIFWDNNAFTLSQPGPGATLVDQGFIDFEIRGTSDPNSTFTPRFSDLTNGQILVNGTMHDLPGTLDTPPFPQYLQPEANFSADPNFVTPFTLELGVSGSRLDPQMAAVTITGTDPPVGLTGDYHLGGGSPAFDRGAGFSTLTAPAPNNQTPAGATIPIAPCSGTATQILAGVPADYDRQNRPMLRTTRGRTPWDVGADEAVGVPIPIPGNFTALPGTANDANFNWNNTGHPSCASSTEPR